MNRYLDGEQAEIFSDAVQRALAEFTELLDLATMEPPRRPAEWAMRHRMLSEGFRRLHDRMLDMAAAAQGPEVRQKPREE